MITSETKGNDLYNSIVDQETIQSQQYRGSGTFDYGDWGVWL